MLKEFIDHIQRTTKAQIYEKDGHTYAVNCDGGWEEIRPVIDHPDAFTLNSLDALVKMVRAEGVRQEDQLYITIPDPLTVFCRGGILADSRFERIGYYMAKAADVPGGRDCWMSQEEAIIKLRSQFAANEGTEYLLDLLSRISTESAVTSKDNGITQTVEATQGVALQYSVKIKPIVALRPYRTFQEVEQPESDFLVRLDKEGRVGLFEADGGMWRLAARRTIKAWLEEQLAEEIEAGSVIVAL